MKYHFIPVRMAYSNKTGNKTVKMWGKGTHITVGGISSASVSMDCTKISQKTKNGAFGTRETAQE